LVSLRKWEPCFNPRRKVSFSQPIWVKVPRFPSELLSLKVLKETENVLGAFVGLDDNFFRNSNRTICKILVD